MIIVPVGEPDDSWTLAQVKAWLKPRQPKGVHCPACGQFSKIYKRSISCAMVLSLSALYKAGQRKRREWVHLTSVDPVRGGDSTRLTSWGLLVNDGSRRDDGGKAGWYKVTELGERWLHNEVRVPKYARIYDDTLLELCGEPWGVEDALKKKFNLRELLDDE